MRNDLRVFIPVGGTPFLHPSYDDQPVVRIPIEVPLPIFTGYGMTDSKYEMQEPAHKRFRRHEVRHGLSHHSYIYLEEFLGPDTEIKP